MAATKEQLLAKASQLGIPVDQLPHDGQDGPSNKTLEDAIAAVTGELPVNVDTFIVQEGQPVLAVPFAGLLDAQPELRSQDLKPSEWRALLDAYLTGHVTEPVDDAEAHPDDA